MSNIVFYGLIILLLVGFWFYRDWLFDSIKNRNFTTSASPEQVRELFTERVAKTGWKVVDDGNPMIAQSSLAAGIRQQLRLITNTNGSGQTSVIVGPSRIVTKGLFLRIPSKAHTLRIRMDSFVKGVRALDPAIDVTKTEVKSR